MPDSIIDRSGAEALIPEDYFAEIQQGVTAQSIVLAAGRRLPNMQRNQKRFPVLDVLPIAYFNNANSSPNDISYKKTSRAAWEDKFIDAEELSVIVPVPENVLDDSEFDIWGEIRPLIVEAFGNKIDGAVFFGQSAPNAWPENITAGAIAAGNAVELNSITVDGRTDLYNDLLAEDGVLSLLEADGYMANGHVTDPSFRGKLRGLRDDDGQPLFKRSLNTNQDMQASTNYELDGAPMFFMSNGAFDPTVARLVSGDWRQLVYSIRKDITTKVLTEAVIQDPDTKDIVYNLAQQDMIALRVVMRLGWQIPNPVNRLNPDSETRYPFSVLVPEGSLPT